MNTERILKLANRLDRMQRPSAKPKVGFNMLFYTLVESFDRSDHQCKTVCCAAGHAILAFGTKKNVARYKKGNYAYEEGGKGFDLVEYAAHLLGMDTYTARAEIFLRTSLSTPRAMARHLRELVAEEAARDT